MKKAFFFMFSFLLIYVSFPTDVYADMGRKPSVRFNIQKEKAPIESDFDAVILSCDKKDTSEEYLFHSYSPEYDLEKDCYWEEYFLSKGFLVCEGGTCRYNYFLNIPSDIRFAIYFPDEDKTYVTKSFTVEKFDSEFDIELLENGMAIVSEKSIVLSTANIIIGVICFVFSILCEMTIALLFLVIFKIASKVRIILTILLANFVTLAFLWLIAPSMPYGFNLLIFLLYEVLIVSVEVAFVYLVNKKHLKLWHVFAMVGIGNAVTFLMSFLNILLGDV